MGGATVSVPWAAASPGVSSIVQLWYPGEEGGSALADILFGDANPSGRMSETVFVGLEQLPKDYLSVTMSDAPGRTHRYLSTAPLYAFGFGMSYTARAYSGLTVSNGATMSSSNAAAKVTVRATVACVDGPAGDEVVQLYSALRTTAPNAGKRSVPLRELKAFTRVSLAGCGKVRVFYYLPHIFARKIRRAPLTILFYLCRRMATQAPLPRLRTSPSKSPQRTSHSLTPMGRCARSLGRTTSTSAALGRRRTASP